MPKFIGSVFTVDLSFSQACFKALHSFFSRFKVGFYLGRILRKRSGQLQTSQRLVRQ